VEAMEWKDELEQDERMDEEEEMEDPDTARLL